MLEKNKNWNAFLKLFGLTGLIAVIALALILPGTELFQGYLTLRPGANTCQTITLSSIPTPLDANKGAIIVIKTQPELWNGSFRVLSSDGIISDNHGNEGSFIETNEKIVNFSGGEANSKITVQAIGEENTQCVGVLNVVKTINIGCRKLEITTTPSPLTENESAEIIIHTTPENWNGTFLVQAESGKLLLTETDREAEGEKTNILLTSSRKILYGGGKSNEKITIKALGEGNQNCRNEVEIKAKE